MIMNPSIKKLSNTFFLINVLVPAEIEGLSLGLAVLVLGVEHGPPVHQLQAQLEGGSDQPLVVALYRYLWNTTLQ